MVKITLDERGMTLWSGDFAAGTGKQSPLLIANPSPSLPLPSGLVRLGGSALRIF